MGILIIIIFISMEFKMIKKTSNVFSINEQQALHYDKYLETLVSATTNRNNYICCFIAKDARATLQKCLGSWLFVQTIW
jgi:hypothetical protein